MKAFLVAVVVVSLFAGAAAAAVAYSFVLGETEARYQKLLDDMRAENLELQSRLSEAENTVNRLRSDLSSLQTSLQTAENRAQQFSERINLLENRLNQLSSQLEAANTELKNLRSSMESIKNVMALLENDRVLISWLRSEPPGTREGDREYWNETRALAVKSDPNLVLTVDKILDNLDLYYDWVERFPQLTDVTRDELIRWCPLYIDWLLNAPPGVEEYNNAVNQLREEILLTVIAHIDSLSRVLEG